jgi:L-malate glycosyltransferase
MRIAFISTMSGFPWGGSEYLWAATAEQALKDGHEVIISLYNWSMENPLVKSLQNQGAKIFPRSRSQSSTFLSRSFRKLNQYIPSLQALYSPSVYKPVFESNPDVICISQGGMCDAIYFPELNDMIYESLIPFVVICQLNIDTFIFNDSTRSIVREQLDRASSIAFVSNHNLKLAERQLALNLQKAIVVQNPVNLINRSYVPFPEQQIAMFASVARLETAYKGQDILFEALSVPEWKERCWKCKLYGSGPDRAYLQSLAQHYDIEDRIQFEGHVSNIRSIWAENHLLVLPSRGEGTPLSLVEAMLCGRPAVVTDVGGHTEWIEESKTGFIAEATTAKSLRATLERAWLEKDRWKSMGIDANEYAISKFDPSPGKTLLENILEAAK